MKILVADDNVDNRQLLFDIFSAKGYRVILAEDGLMTVDMTYAEHPDLIILDIAMPGMSGYEVCEKLKSDPNTTHIPILMLTAMADVNDRVHGLGMGADDYLTKPFSSRELVARVETRLRAKATTDVMREAEERVRRTFERFVSTSVVEQLLANPLEVELGGRLQDVTVMFADLGNFTSLAEHTPPEELLKLLNSYHGLVVGVVMEHGGTIDKFLGDGLMALFNTPLQQDDHVLRAVRAAMHVRAALPEFHTDFDAALRLTINFGIHTGTAVVGNVGTAEIMDFTAVGDTVNVASRLQNLSGNNQILISGAVYQRVADEVATNQIGKVNVKNRVEPILVYEVLEQ